MIPPPPSDPHQHAWTIAEAVVDAWHRASGPSSTLEIPVSVVAVLACIDPPHHERADITGKLLDLPADELVKVARVHWAAFIDARPDLVNRVWPLMRVWWSEPGLDAQARQAAKAAANAAVRAGLLHLTEHGRQDTDLFGPLLTTLRAKRELHKRGQIYSPGDFAQTMARLVTPEEGTRVLDLFAGTGALTRAAAQAMREQLRDPTTVTWVAVDIDELAIACMAVNVVLWGLGANVLLAVGDGLAPPETWMHRAQAERAETVELAATLRRDRQLLQFLRHLERPVAAAQPDQ